MTRAVDEILILDTGESPEELRERRLRVMDRVRETHRKILERRGGVPIPSAEIDAIIDEIRGRTDADLD